MDAESRPKWQRLGELLATRRAQIDPRYTTRKVFVSEVGIHGAVLRDIENAVRDNYTKPVLAAIETAYRWEQGSIQLVLDGGDPIPMTPPGGFATTSGFPPLGVEGRQGGGTETLAEQATAYRLPSWFTSEIARRGVHVESLTQPVRELLALADHFGYTLGELLLNVGMAAEQDLRIGERPPRQSEALADYEAESEWITSSSFLSKRSKEKIAAILDEEHRIAKERLRGE